MDFYNNFKKSLTEVEKVIILKEIIEYCELSLKDPKKYKLEAGPIANQEKALEILKADEYTVPKNFKVSEPICKEDPGEWWIVVRIPTCFSWLKGNCKNNNCGFNHNKNTLIKVEKVNTTDLFRKMYNRNRKLKHSGIRKKDEFYINPFTGKEIPVRTPEYEAINKKILLLSIQNKTILVNTLKDTFKICKMKRTSESWSMIDVKEVEEDDDKSAKKVEKIGSWADVVKN